MVRCQRFGGWGEAGCTYALDSAFARSDYGLFSPVWHGLDPRCIAVYFMEGHLILVAAAGYFGKLACLVSEQGAFGIVDLHDEVLLLRHGWDYLPIYLVA